MGADQSWRRRGLDGGAMVPLTPVDQPLAAPRPFPPTRPAGTFAEVSADWVRSGFSGRAWTDDGRVGIATPPYADSLIVSGPARLRDLLLAGNLEAHPVDRTAALPITTD